MAPSKFRLVTRSDFDGLVCGMLLRDLNMINDIRFVHPKDVQDGTVAITARDILANLPHVPGCHLAFDRYADAVLRDGAARPSNHIIGTASPSAARVAYRHFGGAPAFPRIRDDLMAAADRADAADVPRDDILDPRNWALLAVLMDTRTGLDRFRGFRLSNPALMRHLIEHCRGHDIDQVLALPDVAERAALYHAQHHLFVAQLRRCTTVHGRLAMLDLRDEAVIHAGNRFMIHALFPQCDISVHVLWGLGQASTVFAIRKSVLHRRSPVNVGAVCLQHGGSGHQAAGTCQVANDQAEAVRRALIPVLSGQEVGQAA